MSALRPHDDRDDTGEAAEASAVRARYARRPQAAADARYSLANPAALLAMQGRQRAIVELLRGAGRSDFAAQTVLEFGSGSGGNLLELLWLGFRPEHLAGVELLPERHEAARARLPAAVQLTLGDATGTVIEPASVDIAYASTVFSSLLDDAFRQRFADAMWRAVRPGGGVLWYDFTVDNPANADVRGVPVRQVRELFPEARITGRRLTLLPPLARRLVRLGPAWHQAFDALPWLRTHWLAWIAKPGSR